MAGGRLRRLTCFFASHTELLLHLLLLWRCLHDVEASECPSVVHKRVGDTVELSSCLPPEGVNYAIWKYNDEIVAELNEDVNETSQFKDRTSLNPTNLSLTLTRLTLQDSGDYSFISEVNDVQRTTVTITLQVHAPLTPPVLTVNSKWNASTESCTVLLDCSSTSDSNVNYNWTVKNQTHSGSRLQYAVTPQEGGTTFTCTIFNLIANKSASKTVNCDNSTAEKQENFPWLLTAVAAGACLSIIIIIIITLICVCLCQRKQTAEIDSHDPTVYADISEFVIEDKPTHPQSEYAFVRDHRPNPVRPMPHSVYDKIQLNRVRIPPESPYQDV